jgi:hypothetical protein
MPDAEQVPDFVRDDRADQVVVPRHRQERDGAESGPSRQPERKAGQAGDGHHHRACRAALAVSDAAVLVGPNA